MKGCLIMFILFTGIVHASDSASKKYTINSDSQLLLSNGNIKAIGNVHAVSGNMIIDAEEAVYHRENLSNTYLTATGKPIKYNGIAEDGKPFSGSSKNLKYTPETGEMILKDEALVNHNGNTLSAEIITYNIITKRMKAYSVAGKQVISVIHPDKVTQKGK